MRRPLLMVFALALAGCERGCLMRWFSDHQDGVRPSPTVRGQELDLGGIDCSDGLLRCHDGVVEASRIGHLPARCGQRAKSEKKATDCACPWDAVARCVTACADETTIATVATEVDGGASQMCRPTMPVARPILVEDHPLIDVCSDEGITCRDGIVSTCDSAASPSHPVAFCIFGCAAAITVDPVEGDGLPVNLDGPIAILCRRSAAEPR